jgi:conjugative transposon TraK protein
MFNSLKNIDSAFRRIRATAIIAMMLVVIASMYCVFVAYRVASAATSKVYILSSGKALEAFAADRKENLPVEAKDHIKTFHQYFFTLSPDDQFIRAQATKAFYLADGSAKRIYDDLEEKGYYAGIVSGNVNQGIEVDSIELATNNYPFHFRCYATQRITRSTSVVTRLLLTEGELRNVPRSENNAHGFLIEKFTVVDNRDLKIEQR